MSNWTYETGKLVPNHDTKQVEYHHLFRTKNKTRALQEFHQPRTYLNRYRFDKDDNLITQFYDPETKTWNP